MQEEGVIEPCQAQKHITGSVSRVCQEDNESDNKIYYTADTVLVGTIIGGENHSQIPHNNLNQDDVHSEGGVDAHGLQGGGGGGGRDQGGQEVHADGQGEDSRQVDGGVSGEGHSGDIHLHLRDQAPHRRAALDQDGEGGRVDEDTHQGGGRGGGEGRVQRVGDCQKQIKSGRKPAKWMVPKKRGIVPDGMVQTRLLSFVGKFPNLGVQGGGKDNASGESLKSFEVKTASCQSGLGIMDSGGKRRFLELGDNETGGQPRKVQKR